VELIHDDVRPLMQSQMERAIRAKLTEYEILQAHDVYTRVKSAIDPAIDATERELGGAGFDPSTSVRAQRRNALTKLRTLLNTNAKERCLQNCLMNSGLLAVTCKVVQEVTMRGVDGQPGMRMDLVLEPAFDAPTQIIELKRGSHLLLARRGKPTEKLSSPHIKAVEQLKNYGDRLESDAQAVERIEARYGIQINKTELRLIAGRKLSNADEYSLLSTAESEESPSSLQLQICTWDGFLAELERIVD
jgi:Domain of unknown function (DUF4263)